MLDLGPVDLLVPVVMILVATLYIPLTAGHLLLRADFTCFIDFYQFQQIWFQRFWSFFGWLSKPLFAPDIEATLNSAHGIVLDVGSGAGRQVSERTEHEQGMCSFVRIRCCVRLFVCQFRACSLVCSVRSHIFRFRNEVHCLALIYLVLPDISDSVSLVVLARTSS